MTLVFDIGNTNVVVGVFDKNGKIKDTLRIYSSLEKTKDEYGILLKSYFTSKNWKFKKVVIGSVVPRLTEVFKELTEKYFNIKPIVLRTCYDVKYRLLYGNPKELGIDRLANAVAAAKEYGYPAVVVDFGTATTFDVVDETGSYRGGIIMPGFMLSYEALVKKAAKLFKVQLIKPKSIIGITTEECLQSGIYYGVLGQVHYVFKELKKELGTGFKKIATGGLHSSFRKVRIFDAVDANLTLKGLFYLKDMVRKNG